jgi:hypothetical protein
LQLRGVVLIGQPQDNIAEASHTGEQNPCLNLMLLQILIQSQQKILPRFQSENVNVHSGSLLGLSRQILLIRFLPGQSLPVRKQISSCVGSKECLQ